MPRRGKAATRQARQRRAQQRPLTAPPRGTEAVEDAAVAPSPASRSAAQPRARGERQRAEQPSGDGASRLSAAASAEYHYVARDLRSIGQVAAVMALALAAAFVAVRIFGIGPA